MLTTFTGYRSYIIASLGVIYAISGYLTGHIDLNTAITLLLGSGGLAGLRSAIDNKL